MPGQMIDYGARALKPVENYVVNYCKLWDSLDDPDIPVTEAQQAELNRRLATATEDRAAAVTTATRAISMLPGMIHPTLSNTSATESA